MHAHLGLKTPDSGGSQPELLDQYGLGETLFGRRRSETRARRANNERAIAHLYYFSDLTNFTF